MESIRLSNSCASHEQLLSNITATPPATDQTRRSAAHKRRVNGFGELEIFLSERKPYLYRQLEF